MNDEILLSIIVPVFNVELYIEKCLFSCLKQDIPLSGYEIIVINDGSPDNSLQIAERIAAQAKNMRVISQPNGGLSIARNKGLFLAKGKYVWFVDSDDWIENNCLKEIVACLDATNPDILQLQYRNYYDDEKLNKDFYCIIKGVVNGRQQISNGGLPIPAQFAIYKKSFLIKHKLEFYPGIFHEDCEFKPRVLYLAERCSSYDKVVYNYYQRTNGSITSVVNSKRAFDCLKVAFSIHEFYCNVAKGECASFFHNHISLMINNALSVVGDKGEEFSVELCKHKYLFGHLRKSTVLKYNIEGLIFTLFPRKSVCIYKLLKNMK